MSINFCNVLDYDNYIIYDNGIVQNKKTKRILKKSLMMIGYYRVSLSKKGKSKNFYIHQLVAKHFIPNPLLKSCIDHIDQNKLNNNVSNLRWVTIQENNFNKIETNSTGVYFIESRNKYLSNIGFNGKLIHLGYYDKKSDAIKSRYLAKKKYHLIKP